MTPPKGGASDAPLAPAGLATDEAPPLATVLAGLAADDPAAKLTAALAAAQADFPAIAKNKTGEVRGTTRDGKPYNYTYSYADLGDVLAAVRPVLARNGLAITQPTSQGDGGKVILTTRLSHVGGGALESVVELGQSPANPQAFGGALTYLRRYELVTLLGIAAEEDTDARDVPVGRQGAAPAAELPPWATFLSNDRAGAELAPLLIPVLGPERARAVYASVKNSLGGAPAVLIPYMRLLLDELLDGDDAELSNRLDEDRNRRREAARASQDADAEAPDTPAPEDPPAPAEQARAAAAAADEAHAASRPSEDVEANERDLAAAFREPEPAELPAGKTPAPDVAALSGEEAAAAYRAAGCVCPDPLAATVREADRVDTCPIIGHGIPF